MVKAAPSDKLSVKKANVFTSQDDEFLLDLYSPIISLRNISVYFALRNEIGNEVIDFSSFYLKYQVSEGEFLNALEALEAIGLIKTLYLEKSESSSFVFMISSPRTAGEFLKNELLIGTLRNYTSEEYINSLVKKYSSNINENDYKDVSKKFMDYFQLNNEKGIYESINAAILTRKPSKISLSFNRKEFINKLNENSSTSIKENAFSDAEYVKLARLAALYGYDEEMMASLLNSSSEILKLGKLYDKNAFGERIDFKALENACKQYEAFTYTHKAIGKPSNVNGTGGVQDQIRMCDRLTTKEYLKMLQKGGEPARSDERLVNKLIVDMGVPQNVANALLFYVLKVKCNNVLSPNYVEKIAAALVREGCETAVDAIDYMASIDKSLKERNFNYRKNKEHSKGALKEKNDSAEEKMQVSEISEDAENENVDDESGEDAFDKFINSL